MTDTIGQSKRKRIKVACEPCRERKRRCNGRSPCTSCSEWGYDCYYESHLLQSKLQSVSQPSYSAKLNTDPDFSAANQRVPAPSLNSMIPGTPSQVRSLEANSGAAFMRRVGLKIDPTNAPKLNLFGWNIGARKLLSGAGPYTALSIIDIISERDLKKLANVYFSKVDPCYGFIDRHTFYERLESRWRTPLASNEYDGVLLGVAALGSLFSQRNTTITELHLVESARSILDLHQVSEAPSVDLVTGWVLRVIYMRMTASPHATWLASSTLIHLIEASGLHLEACDDTVFPQHNLLCDPDIRRRLIGVAQHVNM